MRTRARMILSVIGSFEGAAESSAARSSLATMSRSAGRASSGPGAIMMMSMLSCGAPGGGAR